MLIVLCPNISPNWCIRNLCPEGNQRAEDLRTLEENSTPRAIGSQPTVRNEIIWRGLKNNKAGSHPRNLIYYSEMLHGACNRFPGNSNVQSRSRSTAVGALNCWLVKPVRSEPHSSIHLSCCHPIYKRTFAL